MAKFQKGQTPFISYLHWYDTFGEALQGVQTDYDKIKGSDIRYLAREANKGLQYIFDNSRRKNISNYQIYKDTVSVIRSEFRKAKINFNEIFNVTNKDIKINTSTKNAMGENVSIFTKYNQEQRQTIAAAFEYIRRSPFTSQTKFEQYNKELVEQTQSKSMKTMFSKYKLTPSSFNDIMRVFQDPRWQALRKKAPYPEIENNVIVDYLEDTNLLNQEELNKVLNSMNIIEFMDIIDDILKEKE